MWFQILPQIKMMIKKILKAPEGLMKMCVWGSAWARQQSHNAKWCALHSTKRFHVSWKEDGSYTVTPSQINVRTHNGFWIRGYRDEFAHAHSHTQTRWQTVRGEEEERKGVRRWKRKQNQKVEWKLLKLRLWWLHLKSATASPRLRFVCQKCLMVTNRLSQVSIWDEPGLIKPTGKLVIRKW